jgi:hypothetical protein
VGTPNSQKRSPRSSAKSKQQSMEIPEKTQRPFEDPEDEQYIDRSFDHVARIRAAKEAAQRAMESFGDVSEYDVTILQGQLRDETVAATQSALEFGAKEEE